MKIITVNKIMCSHCVDEIEATVKQPFMLVGGSKVAVDHGRVLSDRNSAKCERLSQIVYSARRAKTHGVKEKIPDYHESFHPT